MPGTTLGTAYVQIMPSTKGIGPALSEQLSGPSESAGKSAGLNIANAIKGVVAAAGIGTVVKEALEAGADLQQSFGGVETLYGDAADAVKNYAAEAAKAGISANDYAEQAVSFGAALRDAYGGDTAKAAEAANAAIMAVADNSAKMGTDIGSVTAAYQGFAKGQYQLLDNLKLGYGGTKTEMERLLKDAEKFSGVHYDIDNLGDVYNAIGVIQENLGLAGVAAEEAKTTFSGSFGAMKAAATNLLANLTLGEDISEPLSVLYETVSNFIMDNLLPMVGNLLSALPGLIGQALDIAFQEIPGLMDVAIGFINNLTAGMTSGEGTLTEGLRTIGSKALEMFKQIDWKGLGIAVINFIKAGLEQVGSAIWEFLKWAGNTALEWFKNIDWKGVGQSVINFIVDGLAAIGNFVWEKLLEIGESAKDWITNIDWQQVGRDMVDFIVNGLTFVYHTIPQKLLDIGNEALNWIKNIDWWGLGRSVIDGIVNGIKWAGGAIKDTLLGFADEAWRSVKSFFGISSPSKLMRETIGKWLPLGIAEGIEDEADTVADSLNAAAMDAVDGFDANFAIKGTPTGNGPVTESIPVVINVYPSAGMDERRLAEKVASEMTLWERQRRAARGTA